MINIIGSSPELDLNNLKKGKVWVVNNNFKRIDFLPDAIIWNDFMPFFISYENKLVELEKKGVELIARQLGTVYKRFNVTTYKTTWFKEKVKEGYIYTGKNSTSGILALGVALEREYKEINLLGFESLFKLNEFNYYKDKLEIRGE